MDRFEYIKPLGHGAFGEIGLYKDKSSGIFYTIKKLKNSNRSQKEVRILQKIFPCHPLLSCYITSFMVDDYIYIVLNYFDGRELKDIIGQISHDQLLYITQYLFEGLKELHNLGIAHRDIGLSNILIDPETFQIQIIDFGVATDQATRTLAGTLRYIAPDLGGSIPLLQLDNIYKTQGERPPIRSVEQLQKADIWAMGLIIYYLYKGKINKKPPLTFTESYNATFEEKYFSWPENLNVFISSSKTEAILWHIISICLIADPILHSYNF